MTLAIAAFGTLLKRSGTTLAEVTSLSTPEMSVAFEDATHEESTGTWDEFIATVKSGGTVGFTCNWIPANATHLQLFTDFEASASAAWTIVYPDAGNYTQGFTAFVERLKAGGELKGKLQLTGTLKISGPVTNTP